MSGCSCNNCGSTEIPVGPTGAQGPQGNTGATGAQGSQGIPGSPGYLTWSLVADGNMPQVQLVDPLAYDVTGRVARFILKGGSTVAAIKVAARTTVGARTFKMRIKDMVTGNIVCEVTLIDNIDEKVLIDMGTIANINGSDTLYELQVEAETGGAVTTVILSSIYVLFS